VGATAALVAAALVPLIVEQAIARPAAATVEQIRHNLASTPTDPYLHERLAWALEAEAAADPARSGERRAASLAHMQRAVTLQPENPYLRRSLAALALAGPDPAVALAIESGRAGVERDPALLGGLVDALAPLALTDAQWTDLVPPLSAERANLASQLESRGLLREALSVYERALERASAAEEPVIRWALARLLLGVHRPTGALAQADAALARSPGNPELLLTRAQSLEALHAPGALAAYRAALSSAEGGSGPVFPTAPPRLGALVAERLGGDARFSVARYRRALASG